MPRGKAGRVGLAMAMLAAAASRAEAHGYVFDPPSRNAMAAYPDGERPAAFQEWGQEYCPHCLNGGSVCGITQNGAKDYTDFVTGPNVVELSPGEVFSVRSVITAHHRGHVEMWLCKAPRNQLTRECFEANPVEFVEDLTDQDPSKRAEIDPAFPNRAYIPPSDGSTTEYSTTAIPGESSGNDGLKPGMPTGMQLHHRFRVPDNVSGSRVTLLWKYITANSCNPAGYWDYNRDVGFKSAAWWQENLGPCTCPLPAATSIPEQFWNCIDVSVTGNNGSGNEPGTGGNEKGSGGCPIDGSPNPDGGGGGGGGGGG